jgi:uncharacterized protein involved in exopolysaccharide biosynthesis
LQIDVAAAPEFGIREADVTALIQVLEKRREATQARIDALEAGLTAPEDSGEEEEGAETPLEARIAALDDEIAALRSELEAKNAEQRELVQTRDRAWETYQVLLGKQVEENITAGAATAEVRLADTAVVPEYPQSRGVILNTLLAGIVGFMVVAGFVLALDWWYAGEPEPEAVEPVTPPEPAPQAAPGREPGGVVAAQD